MILLVAGVDESGRGPLAGPVVAAAVIFAPGCPMPAVADSKTLGADQRRQVCRAIRACAAAWSVGAVAAADIDRLNIHRATLLAMRRAVLGLRLRPGHALVDGRFCPELPMPATAVVGGDGLEPVIAAASVIAKVYRDGLMERLDRHWPGYGFGRHKGYPTREHLEAIHRLGVVAEHRRSFAPVRAVLESGARPAAAAGD